MEGKQIDCGFMFGCERAEIVNPAEVARGHAIHATDGAWGTIALVAVLIFAALAFGVPEALKRKEISGMTDRQELRRGNIPAWIVKGGLAAIVAILVAIAGFRRSSGSLLDFQYNFGVLDFVGLVALAYVAVALFDVLRDRRS